MDTAGGTYATVRTGFGSGHMNLRDGSSGNLQTVVHPNSTKVRFFGLNGSNLTTTATTVAGGAYENVGVVPEDKMIANLNMRSSSQAGYNFYLFFIYRSKT